MKKIIPVLLSIIFLWVSLYFYASLNNKSNQEGLNYIPKNANFIFKFNTKNFLKSSSYSLLFNSKDQELITSLDNFISKQKIDDFSNKDALGINFTSDLVLFGVEINQSQNYVFVFNLTNPELFNKNIYSLLGKNQVASVDENSGFVLTNFSDDIPKKNILKKYLSEIIKQKHKAKFTKENSDFFQLNVENFKVNSDYTAKKGTITTRINDKELKISGQIELTNAPSIDSKWSLLKKGLHLETCLISNTIQDSIQKYLNFIGFDSKAIQRISLNYYGMELQDSKQGLLAAPVFDLLLTFKEPFQLKNFFKDESSLNKLGYFKNGNVINAGKIAYYVDSIDSKNLFIGRHLNQVVKRKNNILFEINGDASMLTTLKGGGFITSFVQVLPPFKSSKDLFTSFKTMDISSKQINNKVEIKGTLKMKDDKFLYDEFLRFLLNFQGNN